VDFRQIVLLAFQVSIVCTVLGFGLKAKAEDLLYLVRRPGLLARSLLAVYVIMPLFTIALVRMFDFRLEVKIVLVALAISPVPPLLPKKETGAGGHVPYGLALMAILLLVSVVAIPLILEILERIYRRELTMAPGAIARVIVVGAIAPLLGGVAVRTMWPAVAERIERPVRLVAAVLLPVAVLALIAGAFAGIWAAVGDGTVLAIVIVTIAGLAIGHVLGGPNPHHAVVLAFSTACRHPAIALTIATTNFPNHQFGGIILLYLIVSFIVGIPYIVWQKRAAASAIAAES
jgi:BASS family bile acid:Na+ symporter